MCHSVYWFSSYHVGHTQAVRLSDKRPHHLSHFTGPHLVFLLNLFCVDTQTFHFMKIAYTICYSNTLCISVAQE